MRSVLRHDFVVTLFDMSVAVAAAAVMLQTRSYSRRQNNSLVILGVLAIGAGVDNFIADS